TTDHNQFYSNPSATIPPDWSPPTGPTAAAGGNNNAEFSIMRSLLGRGAAEEVTLQGGKPIVPGVMPPLGRHMLTYDATHFERPWHGDADNPFDVAHVLQHLAEGVAAGGLPPSTYPAHPFVAGVDLTSPQWRGKDMGEVPGPLA